MSRPAGVRAILVADVAMRRAAKRAFEGIILIVKVLGQVMKFPFSLKGF